MDKLIKKINKKKVKEIRGVNLNKPFFFVGGSPKRRRGAAFLGSNFFNIENLDKNLPIRERGLVKFYKLYKRGEGESIKKKERFRLRLRRAFLKQERESYLLKNKQKKGQLYDFSNKKGPLFKGGSREEVKRRNGGSSFFFVKKKEKRKRIRISSNLKKQKIFKFFYVVGFDWKKEEGEEGKRKRKEKGEAGVPLNEYSKKLEEYLNLTYIFAIENRKGFRLIKGLPSNGQRSRGKKRKIQSAIKMKKLWNFIQWSFEKKSAA